MTIVRFSLAVHFKVKPQRNTTYRLNEFAYDTREGLLPILRDRLSFHLDVEEHYGFRVQILYPNSWDPNYRLSPSRYFNKTETTLDRVVAWILDNLTPIEYLCSVQDGS